jgi:hypothetical protein
VTFCHYDHRVFGDHEHPTTSALITPAAGDRQQIRLAFGIAINRRFSKQKTRKAGTLVMRMVSPLQGR